MGTDLLLLLGPIYHLPVWLDTYISGDSWYFRLVSCLQRSLWNKKHFVNRVNLLYQNKLVHFHCLWPPLTWIPYLPIWLDTYITLLESHIFSHFLYIKNVLVVAFKLSMTRYILPSKYQTIYLPLSLILSSNHIHQIKDKIILKDAYRGEH